ncbi:hypothetical protein Vadar_007703 [Vaccinium darrowii]|uniref:Uncharacterized protein n=1 Tax=Vaccinium darrowii TaxID=229202 RepID=A0ACB7Y5J7_9ERIC|nr:hypothetical protein Vadar_007703 [Vaccinium darrowii]
MAQFLRLRTTQFARKKSHNFKDTTFFFDLKLENKNTFMGNYYNAANLTLYRPLNTSTYPVGSGNYRDFYQGTSVDSDTYPGFYQGHSKNTHLPAEVRQFVWNGSDAVLEVKLETEYMLKIAWWKTNRHYFIYNPFVRVNRFDLKVMDDGTLLTSASPEERGGFRVRLMIILYFAFVLVIWNGSDEVFQVKLEMMYRLKIGWWKTKGHYFGYSLFVRVNRFGPKVVDDGTLLTSTSSEEHGGFHARDTTFFFDLKLENKNPFMGIYYDAVNLTLYRPLNMTTYPVGSGNYPDFYPGTPVGSGTYLGFYQGHSKNTHLQVEVRRFFWNGSDGVFQVKLETEYKLKIGWWKTKRH